MPKKGSDLIDATSFYFPDPSAKAKPSKGGMNLSNPVAGGSNSVDLMGVDFDPKPKQSNECDSFIVRPSTKGKYAGKGDPERSSSEFK